MRRIIKLNKKPYFLSHAAVGGYEERRGPLGEKFDLCDDSDLFGMKHRHAGGEGLHQPDRPG